MVPKFSLKLFTVFFLISYALNVKARDCNQCELPSLIGAFPKKICSALKGSNFNVGSNRVLLHGPGGNGKTSIPEILAAFHGTEIKKVTAGQIMCKFIGKSAENMRNIFDAQGFKKSLVELQDADKSKVPVKRKIIFIDEVDLIASTNSSEFRSEHEAVMKEFWQLLDQYETEDNKDKFFIICATNRYDLLDPNFVSRFGGNVIEISNPNALARSLALAKFCENKIPEANCKVSEWTEKTDQFSMRDLKKFVQGVHERVVENDNQYDSAIINEEMQVIRNKVEAQKKIEKEKSAAELNAEHVKLSIEHTKNSIEQAEEVKKARKKDDEVRSLTKVALKTGSVIAGGGAGAATGVFFHSAAISLAKASAFAGPFGHWMLPISGAMFGTAIVLDLIYGVKNENTN